MLAVAATVRTAGTGPFIALGAEERRRIAEAPRMTENECYLTTPVWGYLIQSTLTESTLNARACPLDNIIRAPEEEQTNTNHYIIHDKSV